MPRDALKGSVVQDQLQLISHNLCPYVQRAVIVAFEKRIAFQRIDIDLGNKPDWFLAFRRPVSGASDTMNSNAS